MEERDERLPTQPEKDPLSESLTEAEDGQNASQHILDDASDLSPDQMRYDTITRKHDTAVLSNKAFMRRTGNSPVQLKGDTSQLNDNREIILVIRGMVERLVLKENKPVILGRSDMKTRFVPDVDLTPYGALDRGVSREHSKIHLEEDRLYITDLDSTNGTFLAGKRLDPHVPTLIRKGDELLLGRLAVQILFR